MHMFEYNYCEATAVCCRLHGLVCVIVGRSESSAIQSTPCPCRVLQGTPAEPPSFCVSVGHVLCVCLSCGVLSMGEMYRAMLSTVVLPFAVSREPSHKCTML